MKITTSVTLALVVGLSPLTAAQTPKSGGSAVIGLIQEPGQLNRFVTTQSGALLSRFTVEPLFVADARGKYQPVLAASVPTVQNGGVSADFLTVKYTLKPNIRWSDGKPFSADDLVFTFEAYKNPGSTPAGEAMVPAYQLVESVTKLSPTTVQVRMKRPNPGYLELFEVVLPRHKFESSAIPATHPQMRVPLGTGPFVVKDWKTGDSITFARNENYRQKGKPYLDEIRVRVIPTRDVAFQSLISGQIDTVFFPATADLPPLIKAEKDGKGVKVALQQTKSWVEWLWLNQASGGDPKKPHPVLGDPAIREAIDRAIDRKSIIDQVLEGLGSTTGSFTYSGFAATPIPAVKYNPTAARALLERAGWKRGADGVRSKNGVRASLRFQTIAGDTKRELYQQLIQQNLKDIGIEVKIQNVPSNTIFGTYKDGGLIKRGNYDLVMSRAGYVIDPASWAAEFTSAQVPSAGTPEGTNRVFYSNATFDRLVNQAATMTDTAGRRKLYGDAARLFAKERPAIPLYSSAWGWAWRDRLGGVNPNYWRGIWESSAEWFVAK